MIEAILKRGTLVSVITAMILLLGIIEAATRHRLVVAHVNQREPGAVNRRP